MSNAPQSVERALRILLSFDADERELSVGEIAALLGVHKSTASRLTATLRAHGLLERTPGNDRFRLGPEVARLGLLALAGRDLITVARAPMDELAARTGETVTLSILDGAGVTTVAQVDSPHVVGPRRWIGRSAPLHASSDGKVVLAFDGAVLPEGDLAALTPHTHVDRTSLSRELAQVREQGWAQAVGELEEGLHGVAAPVLDAAGRCNATLSVSGPSYRLTLDTLQVTAVACVEAATRIGSQLASEATAAGGDRAATR
jgi:DNA-binding IclR family transcriptional regulator